MILSCQCPQDKAKNAPDTKPTNFPLGFCSAIKLIALAYYYENPTSTLVFIKPYIISNVVTEKVVVQSIH